MRLKYSEAMNQPRACMRCAWWEPFNSAAGHCKRMPPVRVDDDAEGAWPMTGRADWCGEYLEVNMDTSAGPPTASQRKGSSHEHRPFDPVAANALQWNADHQRVRASLALALVADMALDPHQKQVVSATRRSGVLLPADVSRPRLQLPRRIQQPMDGPLVNPDATQHARKAKEGAMTKIVLPPLPDDLDPDEICAEFARARDLEVARVVLEAAAKYLDSVHATRLHKFANAIRALEFHHE